MIKRRAGPKDIEQHRSPRTAEALLSDAEDREDAEALRKEIRDLPPFKSEKEKPPVGETAPPPEVKVVGGEDKGQQQQPPKPPIVEVTPDFSKPLSAEQFETAFSSYEPKNEHQRRGFPGIKAVAKQFNDLAVKYQSENAELQKQLKEITGKALPEEEINRLRGFENIVTTHAVKALPKWRKYDQDIADLDKQATDFLISQAPEGKKEIWEKNLKVINEKRGGLRQFSTSNRDSRTGQNLTESQYFKGIFYDFLNPQAQQRFNNLVIQANQKAEEKVSELAKAEANSKETIEKTNKQMTEEFNRVAQETTNSFLASEMPKLGLPTSRPEIPDNATSEQKKELTAQQAEWDEADKEIVRTCQPSYRFTVGVKEDVQSRIESYLYRKLVPRYIEMQTKLEEALAEVKKRDQKFETLKDLKRTNRLGSSGAPAREPQPDVLDQTDEQRVQSWAHGK